MDKLYNSVCFYASRKTTTEYSTSFSLGIKLFQKDIRQHIYNIYGYVRFADEIVDTYKGHEMEALLNEFENDTFVAIRRGISLNPIIHSFQHTVNTFNIDHSYIRAFLESMYMDIEKKDYNNREYYEYIYGSAEVIGLMCLKVFVPDEKQFKALIPSARALGAAFQKVNFIRDLKSDLHERGRIYFPNMKFDASESYREIFGDIQSDFEMARLGIQQLPNSSKYGVLLALSYYENLLKEIKKRTLYQVLQERIRINNVHKIALLINVFFQKYVFNIKENLSLR